jgi:DUF1009 family protein
MAERIGIIAGNGQLPVATARGIRAAGDVPVAVGFTGQYDAALPGLCDRFRGVGTLRIGQWARRLRAMGARRAVMVGGVDKSALMYMPLWQRALVMRPDWRTLWLYYRVLRKDKRSQTLLAGVADQCRRAGIQLIDTTRYIPDHLATTGQLTTRSPTAGQRADLEFGWPILLQMNRLEIGQSIAVRDRDVIAVEAVEGTDRMIRRAGELARGGGWTLLKGSGPDKDLRFDVPTVGLQTVEALREAGAACLVLEAGRVILLEKEKVLAAAEAAGIAVVGLAGGE